jgi:hypothetical protein
MNWAYGITTTGDREYLPRTLASLAKAGFDEPRIFVDTGLGAFGRWYTAAVELLVRNPAAHRYILFQDDLVCVSNLREYLDSCTMQPNTYWNLFTFSASEHVIVNKKGWVEGAKLRDWEPLQKGAGALGLVFSREALMTLLQQKSFVEKPASANKPTVCIDGAVVTAMNGAGYREYVHAPSLLQHTGTKSTLGGKEWKTYSMSFPGEDVVMR